MHSRHASEIAKGAAGVLASALLLSGGCRAPRTAVSPGDLAFPPLRFRPPKVERVELDCGAPLYLLPDHTLPLFSLLGLARAGSAFDPTGKEGLAALTAGTMRTGGTAELPPDVLDRELEFIATSISTNTDRDAGSATLSCLSKDIGKALELYLGVLLRPRFADERVRLRKDKVREAIHRWNDQPGKIVLREFRRLVYRDAPYGHPVIGEPGSMDRINRADLIAFHGERFLPSGMIFAAAGDFDRNTLLKRLNEAFGPGKKPPPLEPPPVIAVEERSINYFPKDTEQAHIVVGHLGITRDNPDYLPLAVMNEILGAGSLVSRLIESIRTSRGLAYYASSRLTVNVRTGLFYVVTHTKEASATEALSLILGELERIRSEPVSDEELARARESITNSFVFRFTTPSQIARQMAYIEFFGLPRDYLETYIDRVSAVTTDDVLRVARRYLHPDRATILVLGERDEFGEPLDKFGKVIELRSVNKE